ncbi:MAG: hypothetical protein ACK55I_47530, partial [bacterium]
MIITAFNTSGKQIEPGILLNIDKFIGKLIGSVLIEEVLYVTKVYEHLIGQGIAFYPDFQVIIGERDSLQTVGLYNKAEWSRLFIGS